MRPKLRRPRRLLAAVTIPIVVSTVGLVPAEAKPRKDGPPVPSLMWTPCGEEFPGVECAVADVPLDYDDPHGVTTSIALARVPAIDQANRVGTVFVNPGGPGGSGVGLMLAGFGDFLSANLGGRLDVVSFDPRGVGASEPLHCFESVEELESFFLGIPVFPYQPRQYRPFFDRFRSLGTECFDDNQAIVSHMSTADVVRDLDLLRQAVGDTRLTYLGFSYGSYIGNTYANLFPHTVRALVIDGVLDPRLWSSGWQIQSDRVATQEEFEEFLRLCDEAGPDCAFASPEGAGARWEALARAVRAAPLELPDLGSYTYDLLINDAAGAMYSPEVWGGPDGFGAFLDFIADAVLGDQAAAARASSARAALVDRLTLDVAEADYPNGFDSYLGNHCADADYPRSLAAWVAVSVYAEVGSRFGPWWWWFNAGCSDWPVAEDRYAGPWRARTSAPVLVVGNYFDGVTDYAGAQASARLLKGSRLLSYAGWGHTAYGRSECVTQHVNSYLVAGTLPPSGTVCPANPNPFLASAARTASSPPLVGLPPTWLVRS